VLEVRIPKARNTKQRQVILEVLRGTNTHPTADWLYQKVRERIPNVSLGTVYRNLGVLKDQEVIQELRHAGCQSRYDGNPQPHYHFFCLDCGRVDNVSIPYCAETEKSIKKAMSGYDIKGHNTEFYGLCPDCTKNN
jgi:Fe2+ or Zn2+ uptake regulation protein